MMKKNKKLNSSSDSDNIAIIEEIIIIFTLNTLLTEYSYLQFIFELKMPV